MKVRIRRPSPAMGVALAALALSVGGGNAVAQDAYSTAKRLISGKSIKKGSIPANRLTTAARTQLKGATGPTGPVGPIGPAGPPGSPDTSKFYDMEASDARFLGFGAKAADADQLDGQDSTEFLGATAKAANADAVDGLDSTALARAGKMIITMPGTQWMPHESSDPLTVTRYTDGPRWIRTAPGPSSFLASIPLPAAANGRRLQVESFRYCYRAGTAQILADIYFQVFRHADDFEVTMPLSVGDPTDRTDAACRVFTPTNPTVLHATDAVELFANVAYSEAGPFIFGPVSVLLSPTDEEVTTMSNRAPAGETPRSGRGGVR